MPQTLTSLLYHVIFSTKNREPSIDASIRDRLFAYIGGIVNEIDGKPVIVNGVADHVHVLAYLPPTLAVSDALRTIKTNSSRWVHETNKDLAAFAWQAGYAAFAVSRSVMEDVRRYIQEQEEHHRTLTYEDEYRAFLRKHGIEFDERYVWG